MIDSIADSIILHFSNGEGGGDIGRVLLDVEPKHLVP